MRMVLHIAKAELRNLFYSPVAWLLLIAFIVQCAWLYTDGLYSTVNWQDIYLRNNPQWDGFPHASLTRSLFGGVDGFFDIVQRNLYYFVPLLTMGLIGKEVQSGTIRLLYSAPVKIAQIVYGKFLAMLVYNCLLVLVVSLFFFSAMFSVIKVDYGMLFSAALGLFLITSAYAAIGTFMSSLSTYQVVTAIGTFMIIFCLTLVNGVLQKYDFIRDLTYFLHISGRTEKMLAGLITTKDVMYFLVIIAMFLGFTLLKLQAAREVRPWYQKVMRYASVVVVCLLVGYVSSRPALTGYWDTTQQNVNTIHEETQQIIKDMGDEELEVTLYTNLLGPGVMAGWPQSRNNYLTGLWEPYLRFKPDIKFRYEYYYDSDSTLPGFVFSNIFRGKSVQEVAKKTAELYEEDIEDWKTPAEMKKVIDLRPENLRLVMQLKYKGRSLFLRTFDDNTLWPDEDQVASALKKLHRYPDYPRLAFVTAHYERSIYKKGEREYRNHTAGKETRGSLINLGFDVTTIDLDKENIPDDLTTLVLADPKSALSEVCVEKLKAYITNGGNLMVIGEPGKQAITNPVLKQLGLHLMDGVVLHNSYNEIQDVIGPFLTDHGIGMFKYPESPVLKRVQGHAHLAMPGAVAIGHADTTTFKVYSILKPEADKSWIRKRPFVRDSAKVAFDPGAGDLLVKNTGGHDGDTVSAEHNDEPDYATGIALQRFVNNKDQRILVFGDADFLANTNLKKPQTAASLHAWLSRGAFPVRFTHEDPPDNRFRITGKTAFAKKIIFLYVLPAALLIFATILLIRRKRK